MHGLWVMGEEVCNAPSLLDMALGVGLECVDHVRELDAIPDEKDREVVANQVPIAFPVEEIQRSRQASVRMKKYVHVHEVRYLMQKCPSGNRSRNRTCATTGLTGTQLQN